MKKQLILSPEEKEMILRMRKINSKVKEVLEGFPTLQDFLEKAGLQKNFEFTESQPSEVTVKDGEVRRYQPRGNEVRTMILSGRANKLFGYKASFFLSLDIWEGRVLCAEAVGVGDNDMTAKSFIGEDTDNYYEIRSIYSPKVAETLKKHLDDSAERCLKNTEQRIEDARKSIKRYSKILRDFKMKGDRK